MNTAADLALALDPVLFAQAVGFTPDPWQAEYLRSTAPRSLLNCCRQSGKSTATAIKVMHKALYSPGSLTLIVSRAERQSEELFRKVKDCYMASQGLRPKDEEPNALSLELKNRSRIEALPGKEDTVRSFSGVDLLVIDEASRVPDDLYRAVRPMLAVSGGRLVGLSTPFGMRGWWYEAWGSDEAWQRYEIPAAECPRIKPEFLEEEKRALGWLWYTQEYECQFIEAQGALFRHEDIEGLFATDTSVMPLFVGGLREAGINTQRAEEAETPTKPLFEVPDIEEAPRFNSSGWRIWASRG